MGAKDDSHFIFCPIEIPIAIRNGEIFFNLLFPQQTHKNQRKYSTI